MVIRLAAPLSLLAHGGNPDAGERLIVAGCNDNADRAPALQIRESRNGALSKRAGSITTAQTRASTPLTAMPTMRKGSNSNHTIGYRISASNARGQHSTNSKHHSRKAIMEEL